MSESLRRRPTKTSVLIAVDLANHIVSSGLAEGTALPNEKDMADELGVGRASIREALRLLETRGLIRIRSGPGGGPTVRKPEPSDFSSTLEFALQAERATLAEVLRAREDLSPFAARLAASRITAKQVRELRQVLDLLRADPTNDEVFATQGRRFEALLAEAGGNVVVRLMVDSLVAIQWDTIPHIEYPTARRRSVVRSLEQVFDAVAAGDGAAAEAAMQAFVRSGARYWRKFYPDLLSRPIRWTG
jgi:GntR family transcriptional repressor for pyruvate dehydrogenase complex